MKLSTSTDAARAILHELNLCGEAMIRIDLLPYTFSTEAEGAYISAFWPDADGLPTTVNLYSRADLLDLLDGCTDFYTID